MQRAVMVLVVRDDEIPIEIEVPDGYEVRSDIRIQIGFGMRCMGVPPTKEDAEPLIQATYSAIAALLKRG